MSRMKICESRGDRIFVVVNGMLLAVFFFAAVSSTVCSFRIFQ